MVCFTMVKKVLEEFLWPVCGGLDSGLAGKVWALRFQVLIRCTVSIWASAAAAAGRIVRELRANSF